MDDQKQPDTPGIGRYIIGIDPAYYNYERSVVSVMKREEIPGENPLVAYFTPVHQPTLDEYGQLIEQMDGYYGTAIIKETQPPLTFKQLEENMRKWAPHLFTYIITGAFDWRSRYVLQEQREKEWKDVFVELLNKVYA